MAGYQRKTALSPKEVLAKAEEVIPALVGLTRSKGSSHGASFSGEEGTVTLSAHRHGPYTEVVASTDRLRTSRVDYEIQKFLTTMDGYPFQEGQSLNAGGINYRSLKALKILEEMGKKGLIERPGN